MPDIRQCADTAIENFVTTLGDGYGPNWNNLIPGDTDSGWGADKGSWRAQGDSIVANFNGCIGFDIDYRASDLDRYLNETLSDFSTFLVDHGQLAEARSTFRKARANLSRVRASITSFRLR